MASMREFTAEKIRDTDAIVGSFTTGQLVDLETVRTMISEAWMTGFSRAAGADLAEARETAWRREAPDGAVENSRASRARRNTAGRCAGARTTSPEAGGAPRG
jgi:hypothetical protein